MAKAVTHIVPFGREVDDGGDDKPIAEELTNKLRSDEIVIPDLVRGDAIRIKPFPDSPDNWYRNEGLFLVDGDAVIPLDTTIDDYGHVPENFFYPEFPVDYWLDTVTHNNLVPVKMSQVKTFQPEDVKVLHLTPDYLDNAEPIAIPYVETDDFMIVVPIAEKEVDPEKVASAVNHARHVDVAMGDDVVSSGYNQDVDWEFDYKDFNTTKPILVVVGEDVYHKDDFYLQN